MCTERSIRVLIADKHSLVRTGIGAALTAKKDMRIVGEATDGYETQQMIQELKPDLLLFSLNINDSSLNEIMVFLRKHCLKVKVIVLAVVENLYKYDLLAAGITGCLLKDEDVETLVCAIHTVVRGGTWFSQIVLERLVEQKTNNLTKREQHLLKLIARGWNNACIATELCIAQQTVRNYTSCLYDKLLVNSRAEAVVWAKEHGF